MFFPEGRVELHTALQITQDGVSRLRGRSKLAACNTSATLCTLHLGMCFFTLSGKGHTIFGSTRENSRA